MAPWVYDPHAGGVKIPERVQQRTRQRLLAYAEQQYAGKYTRLDIRFRGQFCYIDAFTEPHVPPDFPPPGWPESREEHLERLRNTPTHLCRLRYFGNTVWQAYHRMALRSRPTPGTLSPEALRQFYSRTCRALLSGIRRLRPTDCA